ncbi:MAG TPA: MazG-like family protein [Pyrinomonadaceae bacterium]|nr:MazG-like family protein [Pyrinomonadaceae bacterium]
MTTTSPSLLTVHYENRYTASIDDYFRDVLWIWQRDSTERTVFDLWFHVIDHCSRLVEAVRKERPKFVIDDLANTFMWFLSFIAQTHQSENDLDQYFHLDVLPSDIIWNKYPAHCPACFDFFMAEQIGARNPLDAEEIINQRGEQLNDKIVKFANDPSVQQPYVCACLSHIGFAEDRHAIYKPINEKLDGFRLVYANETRKNKIHSIKSLEEMFESVFHNSYEVFSIENIAFHLLEEVGEVTQSIKDLYTFDEDREPFSVTASQRRRMKFEEELADVFSWIFALMLKIRRVYFKDAQEYVTSLVKGLEVNFMGSLNLADIIWAKYGRTENGGTMFCSGCLRAPCSCKRHLLVDWSKAQKAIVAGSDTKSQQSYSDPS